LGWKSQFEARVEKTGCVRVAFGYGVRRPAPTESRTALSQKGAVHVMASWRSESIIGRGQFRERFLPAG